MDKVFHNNFQQYSVDRCTDQSLVKIFNIIDREILLKSLSKSAQNKIDVLINECYKKDVSRWYGELGFRISELDRYEDVVKMSIGWDGSIEDYKFPADVWIVPKKSLHLLLILYYLRISVYLRHGK